MRKPRGKTPIHLPPAKPDCCALCPLLGIIPKGHPGRPKGSKETHVCLGTFEALSGRGIHVRASTRDSHHPLRRPCDLKWDAWQQLPEQYYMIPDQVYLQYRMPYESSLQFEIIFHPQKKK